MPHNRLMLQFLSDDDLDRIERTAYRLLEEVGLALEHDRAREMLHGHGCRIEGDRAYIPRDVVAWALENVTPDRDGLRRDGSLAFTLGDGQVRFHNGGGQPHALDLDTGQSRPSTVQDVADVTRLLDALPNIDHVTPLFGPQDVPPQLMMVESTAAMLRNTTKPLSSAAIDKPEDVPYVVEMAAACCGGPEAYRQHPNMTISVSPVSPLTFGPDVTGAIITVVESGAPFHSLPAPTLGATGPVTMAGCLAQQHAEILASFVIAAATRPGAVVGYCSRISPIDLRTALTAWGSPEVGMTAACAGQLAHRIGFPCDAYGLASQSLLVDAQHAYERLSNALIPALAGVDMLSGAGNGGGLSAGFGVAVIDDEIISMIKHIVAGCPVDDVTLAYDVMVSVIPGDGVFLGDMHTVKQMRRGALWLPRVSTRGEAGQEASAGVVERAQVRAREILSSHEVEPLSEDASRHLDEVRARARRELIGA
jgi:trimethylamine--corrinoid protein Co-methyltransferase